MTTTHTGKCACGGVRIEAHGSPVAELHCQCRHCQLRSGTGHSSFIVFAGPDAVKIDGAVRGWTVAADSGTMKEQAFCPVCGTPTHVTFPDTPGITAISAGLLDAPACFTPMFVTYASRALPWDTLDASLTRFDEMPTG